MQWEWIFCELRELYTHTGVPWGAKTRTAWLGDSVGQHPSLRYQPSHCKWFWLVTTFLNRNPSQSPFFCKDVSFWENRYERALLYMCSGEACPSLIGTLWIIRATLEKYWDKTKTYISQTMRCPLSLKTWALTFRKSTVQPRDSQTVFLDQPLFLQQHWLSTEKISGKAQAS